MRRALPIPAILVALSALLVCASCNEQDVAKATQGLPPADTTALAALNASPRHGEMVNVPLEGGPALRTWIVYPERKDKAGVVILIHEIFGLSDWMRGVADRLAADGFIAVAPDLITGLGPGGGGTESVSSRDSVVQLVRGLTPDETRRRLDAVRDWATALPAANGKVATMGFCWGGARSFEFAAAEPPPAAAVVFYGSPPDSARLGDIDALVLGHYGGDDARITSTIEATRGRLVALNQSYEPHVYAGAGHGFLRQQSGKDGANLKATQESWPRTIAFLKQHLK